MTDQAIYYIATSFGVVGAFWAIAFIIHCVLKHTKEEN